MKYKIIPLQWGVEKPMHHIIGYIGFLYDSHDIPYTIHNIGVNYISFLYSYTHLYS